MLLPGLESLLCLRHLNSTKHQPLSVTGAVVCLLSGVAFDEEAKGFRIDKAGTVFIANLAKAVRPDGALRDQGIKGTSGDTEAADGCRNPNEFDGGGGGAGAGGKILGHDA